MIRNTASPFTSLFHFEIARGIIDKCEEYGYNIIFANIDKAARNLAAPDIVLKGDVDGLIFLQDIDDYLLTILEKRNLPFVVVDYQGNNDNLYSVNADYTISARAATEYLIDKGHSDIAFMSYDFAPGFYRRIFKGFSEAMQSNSILIPPGWICTVDDDGHEHKAIEPMLTSGERRPTAVFCSADVIAINSIRYVNRHGLKVPEDISFIAIDDILASRYTDPPLTSVSIDKYMMGVHAMDLIMKLIKGEPAERVLVKSDEIIERESVADISKR